jgi:uncharacterized protein YajQ (UPF0234 family)
MPSFDIVSQVDPHELTNAVDQTSRELSTRFDFKGTGSKVERSDDKLLVLVAPTEFQVKQIVEILNTKLAKRGIDVRCLHYGPMQEAVNEARQPVTVRQGVDKDLARTLIKLVKDLKLKVQAAVQGDQIRVSGKKRDDLQQVIAAVKEAKFEMPLQFVNFRD